MSNDDNVSETPEKKIFFLYPTVTVQNRIVTELAQQEYEVYSTRDKDALLRLLKKYPNSVVFVDINENMPENEWEFWITGVLEDSELGRVSLGIVTSRDDDVAKHKYLEVLKLPCGYTIVKVDLVKTVARIMEALESVNAKGRRKYLRATIDGEANASVNLPYNGGFINGQIQDISVVGLSSTLEGDPDIEKNTLIKDIQIRLQGALLKVEGVVFGSRMDGNEKVYVVIFTQRIDPEVRTKIRKYIQQNLQNKMDEELK